MLSWGSAGILFKIGHKLIDLDRLEAEDRDIKALCFQQPGQLRYFDRKTLAIPARVLRNPVVAIARARCLAGDNPANTMTGTFAGRGAVLPCSGPRRRSVSHLQSPATGW